MGFCCAYPGSRRYVGLTDMIVPAVKRNSRQCDTAVLSSDTKRGREASRLRMLDQLGVERDLGVENLGDRTVFLGIFRHLGEFCLVHVRHLGAQGQGRTANAKSFALRLESDGRFGAELGRGKT